MHTRYCEYGYSKVQDVIVMQSTQDALRQWVRDILAARNWTPTHLARQAGISASTLTRLLNDPEYASSLHANTIHKIVAASGITAPSSFGVDQAEGFAEPDCRPIDIGAGERQPMSADQSIWQITGDSLSLLGYVPDDKVIIDMALDPRKGDVVIAQIYNHDTGSAETVLRLYQPPFLTVASTAPHSHPPLIVDNQHVKILGVVIERWWVRKIALSA